MDERELEALFAGAAFERELAALAAKVPYTRELEGYPPHLLFTAAQWENYDSWHEHLAEREARYGRMFPELAGMVRNLGRRIW